MLTDLLDFKFFAPNFLKVKNKRGKLVPFLLSKSQLYANQLLDDQLLRIGRVRAVTLKGRQMGFSTLIQGRYTHRIITTTGKKAYILTHESQATNNLFEITQRYVDNMPRGLCPKPDVSNANQLRFHKFNSGYEIGTARNKGSGRSQTIQLFHGSEVAFWPNASEHGDGIMNAVPDEEGTEIILESTAKGMGNYFHQMWRNAISGDTDYIGIFLPWYWQDEYSIHDDKKIVLTDEEDEVFSENEKNGLTIGHMKWRRRKIASSVDDEGDEESRKQKFKQEYPMTAQEAFRNSVLDTFIKSEIVLKARKNHVDTDAGLILGVDVAIGEKDKFTIIRRRGRRAYKLERHINHNTMQIVGRLRRIIDEERPVKVYIDVIGIGAGVVDRLQELGYMQVEGVNVAMRAAENEKYKNVRAELWQTGKNWLHDPAGVEIPDNDILEADLTVLGYHYDSNNALQIESKLKLKKRGLPSCDTADSLMLTFTGGVYDISHAELGSVENKIKARGMFY